MVFVFAPAFQGAMTLVWDKNPVSNAKLTVTIQALRRLPAWSEASAACGSMKIVSDVSLSRSVPNLSSHPQALDLIADDLRRVDVKMQATGDIFAPLSGAINLLLDSGGKRYCWPWPS